MDKPTMYEFLHSYMHNLYEALVSHDYGIKGITIECSCCPFYEQCQKAAEAGNNVGCGAFIQSMLQDGGDFEL